MAASPFADYSRRYGPLTSEIFVFQFVSPAAMHFLMVFFIEKFLLALISAE